MYHVLMTDWKRENPLNSNIDVDFFFLAEAITSTAAHVNGNDLANGSLNRLSRMQK
jgi:hypothetical protein